MCLWKHSTVPLISCLLSVRQCSQRLTGAQSEPSVMSHAIGHGAMAETFPAGVCCARDKAAGAVTLPEKGVWIKCKTHINIAAQQDENWMWLCTIPWSHAVCMTVEARRLSLIMHVFILYYFAAVKRLQIQTLQDNVLQHLSDASLSS